MRSFIALAALLSTAALGGDYDDDKRVATVVKTARAPFEEAAKKLLSKNEKSQREGFSFLVYSEDLAIRPILGVPPKRLDPSDERGIIDVAEERLGELIKDFRTRLILDLEDKRLIPNPKSYPGPKPEGELPPGRVCDWAYLTLRHVNVASRHESELDWEVGRDTFLEKSNASKDRVIAEYKKTGKWVPIKVDPPSDLESRD
jgi:hypothetical protein